MPPDTATGGVGRSASHQQRREQRMARVDGLPPDIRALVHDYGLNVVQAHLDIGVTKAKHIRHLVETVINEFSPTRGSTSYQGAYRAKGMSETTVR